MAKLYFVDGYHGGIRGHMPEGSWQDILQAMHDRQDWKLSLEIEPESWEYIRLHDNHTYHRLQLFFSDPKTADRVEFISGSYAQPFCWAVNGESNVRQLIHGVNVLHRHFPAVKVDTYAVQEPCFTSALPQILNGLGYVRMSLKNPTSWGGYMAKMPGAIIHLRGSDGSTTPAVPRYECEELVGCSATEASGYDYKAILGFAEKCTQNGIDHPIGMCLQDLGWSSKPIVRDIDVEYITYREYFKRFGGEISGEVNFSQEDVLTALPWGNRIFQTMLKNVRNSENRILQTEKLLAIAETEHQSSSDRLASCREKLTTAWEMLMQAQHHDGYICATCGEGTNKWAFKSNMLASGCAEILDAANNAAMQEITGECTQNTESESEISLRVYSTIGTPHHTQAETLLSLESGWNGVHVYNEDDEEVASQITVSRLHSNGSIGCAILRFETNPNGIGYSTYRVKLSKQATVKMGLITRTVQDAIEVSTPTLMAVFDLNRGGSFVRLLDKTNGHDYASGVHGLGCLRGYSIKQDRFIDTLSSRAAFEILEDGPLCCRLRFSGTFSGINFQNIVTIRSTDNRIDVETTANFHEETDIGYPYAPSEEEKFHGTRRSSCREDYKLAVQLPMGEACVQLTKSAPFDICESRHNDNHFDSWTEIKHNVINGFVDLYQADKDIGLAVYCDHVNGYSLVKNHFTLTLAFGYHGNFWWGYQPLKGQCSMHYSLLPHSGNWEQGNVPLEYARLHEPLLVERLCDRPTQLKRTVFSCDNPLIDAVTILKPADSYQLRLFNSSYKDEKLDFYCSLPHMQNRSADLYGNPCPDAGECDSIGKMEIKTII